MKSGSVLGRAVLATCSLALVIGATVPRHLHGQGAEGNFDWTGEMVPGSTLRVYTTGGTVTVRNASGVQARVRGETQHADGDEIRFLTSREAGSIRICAVRGSGECTDRGIRNDGDRRSRRDQPARADFTVEIPSGVVLHVSSGNGEVRVAGATADVHATTGNGAVSVGTGAATVSVSTGRGAVTVEGARGPVAANTGDGPVRIITAMGPVRASTGRGGIEVSMASLPATDDLAFTTGSGPITLRVPADFSAEVAAHTGNGIFEFDFPLKLQGRMSAYHVRGTIGSGGRQLRMTTGNGSIRVLRSGT